MQPKLSSFRIWLVFGSMLGLFLILILRTAGQLRERGRKFHQWPKVTATVLRYERWGSGYRRSGHQICVYRYDVDGSPTVGRGPDIEQGTGAAPAVPVGGTVEVAYNPAEPKEALSLHDARRPPQMIGLFYLPIVAATVIILALITLIFRPGP
jgi:Protein of unknown function (DUF3592)